MHLLVTRVVALMDGEPLASVTEGDLSGWHHGMMVSTELRNQDGSVEPDDLFFSPTVGPRIL